jgi:hypothetical protein
MVVDEFVDWLRNREYYTDQIQFQRSIPARRPETRSCEMNPAVTARLADRGIDELYAHQADAIDAVRGGRNVVLATPTASGKSLTYTIPAIEGARDHDGRTLYVGPQVALINDQEATLSAFAEPFDDVSVTQYTGALSGAARQEARDGDPSIVLTTPDMLHCGLLSHADDIWCSFFESLDLMVVDEVHEYRGVFGSHVGLVLRRLTRLCEQFDAYPQFVCCSATIGNPREHVATITGQPTDSFALIDEDTSETGPTHWLFWQPPKYDEGDAPAGAGQRRSHHGETMRLFVDLVQRGYQTVAFTRARQTAERYATISSDTLAERGNNDLAETVTAYHAGLRDERRASIEAALHTDECAGVWSTSALELGVDIGSLDTNCTCPYDGSGDCKHVVAVLLEIADGPPQDESERVEEVLADVSAGDLRGFVRDALADYPELREQFLAQFGDDHRSVEEYREEIAKLFEQHADPGVYDAIDFSQFFETAEQYRDRDRYLAAATVYRAAFEEVDEKYKWVDGAYDHYAKTIQQAIDGYGDCILATGPTPEEFDEYAGVLEARATTDLALNSEQFWRALDDLEERYDG